MAYGNDEQRRHAEKDAASCIDISVSRHSGLGVPRGIDSRTSDLSGAPQYFIVAR